MLKTSNWHSEDWDSIFWSYCWLLMCWVTLGYQMKHLPHYLLIFVTEPVLVKEQYFTVFSSLAKSKLVAGQAVKWPKRLVLWPLDGWRSAWAWWRRSCLVWECQRHSWAAKPTCKTRHNFNHARAYVCIGGWKLHSSVSQEEGLWYLQAFVEANSPATPITSNISNIGAGGSDKKNNNKKNLAILKSFIC